MRRFIARTILAAIGVWLAEVLIPGVSTDGTIATVLLVGVLIGVGEVVLRVVQHGTAILLFFLPRALRVFLLRVAVVAIAATLVTDFSLMAPLPVSLLGTTLLLSLLFLLPIAA